MKILLIAPLMDLPTITSNIAVLDLLDFMADTPRLDVDLLHGIMANRLLYGIYHKVKKKYNAIFYFGHGYKDNLKGNHYLFSMINKRNIGLSKDTVFDTMACHTAEGIGMEAVKRGVRAWTGTRGPYYAAFPEKERDFLKDWIDYTTIRFKALIQGKTTKEAYDLFRSKGNYYLNIYKKKIGQANFKWYYEKTKSNLKNTILIGDKNAKLYDGLSPEMGTRISPRVVWG